MIGGGERECIVEAFTIFSLNRGVRSMR